MNEKTLTTLQKREEHIPWIQNHNCYTMGWWRREESRQLMLSSLRPILLFLFFWMKN